MILLIIFLLLMSGSLSAPYIPHEFTQELVEGVNYTFPGGWFVIGYESLIIRPWMIYSCSMSNKTIHIYRDQMEATGLISKLIEGTSVFSLMVDINQMPLECPILFGSIKDVIWTYSTIEINLVELDPSLIFSDSDINIENADVFEIISPEPLGDINLAETVKLFDMSLNGSDYCCDNATIMENSISPPTRRRMLTFRRSGSVNLGATVVFTPIPQITFTVGFTLYARASLLLQTRWFSVKRFRFEIEVGAKFTASAKLKAIYVDSDSKKEKKKRWNIKPAEIRRTYVIPIGGIPVLLTAFHTMDAGMDIEASVSAGCDFEWAPSPFKAGFDCKSTTSPICSKISSAPNEQPENNGCNLVSLDGCELSAFVWVQPTFGISLYHGLFTLEAPIKAGPKLRITYPSQKNMPCTCPGEFEFGVDFIMDLEINVKLLDIKFLRRRFKESFLEKMSFTLLKLETIVVGIGKCFQIGILPDLIENVLRNKCCKPTIPTANPLYPSYPTYRLYPSYPSYPSYPTYRLHSSYPSYQPYPSYPSYPSYPTTTYNPSYPTYRLHSSYPTYRPYPSYPSYPSYSSYQSSSITTYNPSYQSHPASTFHPLYPLYPSQTMHPSTTFHPSYPAHNQPVHSLTNHEPTSNQPTYSTFNQTNNQKIHQGKTLTLH